MTTHHRAGIGRRGFVSGVGVACGIAAVGGARVAFGPPGEGSRADAASPARLGPGVPLRDGWSVEDVHPLTLGAVPVVLAGPRGERVQVDLLRRDDRGPGPVAVTRHYALYLANRGDGRRPTAEAQGLAVMALADVIRAREGVEPVAGLLTLRERRDRHPVGVYSVG